MAIKACEVLGLSENKISKCIGKSLAKIGALCMAGISLKDQNFLNEII